MLTLSTDESTYIGNMYVLTENFITFLQGGNGINGYIYFLLRYKILQKCFSYKLQSKREFKLDILDETKRLLDLSMKNKDVEPQDRLFL